jgi:K+-sensing histidine kinase KdpD
MKKFNFSASLQIFKDCLYGALTAAALTILMILIGRPILGEAVIALLYLVPIGYSTTRWGQASGICTAIVSALAFDYFFIPPFHTFTVGSLESWAVLVIFLIVSVVIVGRIWYGLAQAREHEREARFMVEVSNALAGPMTQEAIASTLANVIRQMYLAELVQVSIFANGSPLVLRVPQEKTSPGKPDCILPIQSAENLVGEIAIWGGDVPLPPADDPLLQAFAIQALQALRRARLDEATVVAELERN